MILGGLTPVVTPGTVVDKTGHGNHRLLPIAPWAPGMQYIKLGAIQAKGQPVLIFRAGRSL